MWHQPEGRAPGVKVTWYDPATWSFPLTYAQLCRYRTFVGPSIYAKTIHNKSAERVLP